MSYVDIQPTLEDWPYDADQISVRKIMSADGAVRIQMRVELGLLQMESEDRPDGLKPFESASLLDYHRGRLADYEKRNGTTLGFTISPNQCHELRYEASIYYRRYVALFVLEDFEDVITDTRHNLDIFDLCRDCAREQEDRSCLESHRPYLLMMDARARAYHALQEDEPASALAHVNRGIMHLKSYFADFDQPELEENSEELVMLNRLATEVAQHIPEDSLVITHRALRAAIEQEQFEEAAKLRDRLKERIEKEAP